MKPLRKAVVTAAGWGTRFLPATKAQPKEMLPLVDKPLIQHIVEEAVASGLRDIIVVTALGKRAIEDHFDRSFELEYLLQEKGKAEMVQALRAISDLANLVYVRQKAQLGLGHAVLTTRDIVGDEPFAVLLPDDVIQAEVPATRQMMDVFRKLGGSVIAVEPVPEDQVSSYGIVQTREVGHHIWEVLGLVEKPAPGKAPSNLGIVGRYILTPEVFEALEHTPPGSGGEIQLTDALQLLLRGQRIFAYQFEGTRYDAGTPLGFLKASVELALQHPELGPQFRQFLRRLDLGGDKGHNP
ncbi:MAG: UTP--glucose-1-phosphate uridylyltransferase GalU [Chloroflexi bacterium]|nr:UTP--glucose-1-phosphate uridylyltransferase GalU [Chloroflexota bacterium]